MLSKVEVFGVDPSPTSLSLPLSGALGTDPIQLQGVDGLGPVKADIFTTSQSGDDDAYSGSRVGNRNIVMKIGLSPDWHENTMESLRALLYVYFMPKTNVKLRFHSTHLPICQIFGYVESLEPDMFSKDPQMQVSIICPTSDFVAIDSTDLAGRTDEDYLDINYEGSRPTGMEIHVRASDEVPSYVGPIGFVVGTVNDRVFTLSENVNVNANATVHLVSIPGEKEVTLVGTSPVYETNLLPYATTQIDWPTLFAGGANRFKIATDAPTPGLLWDLSYFARFGGL